MMYDVSAADRTLLYLTLLKFKREALSVPRQRTRYIAVAPEFAESTLFVEQLTP